MKSLAGMVLAVGLGRVAPLVGGSSGSSSSPSWAIRNEGREGGSEGEGGGKKRWREGGKEGEKKKRGSVSI